MNKGTRDLRGRVFFLVGNIKQSSYKQGRSHFWLQNANWNCFRTWNSFLRTVSVLSRPQSNCKACDRENDAGSCFHPLFSVAHLIASNSLEAELWFEPCFCPIHHSLKSQSIHSRHTSSTAFSSEVFHSIQNTKCLKRTLEHPVSSYFCSKERPYLSIFINKF